MLPRLSYPTYRGIHQASRTPALTCQNKSKKMDTHFSMSGTLFIFGIGSAELETPRLQSGLATFWVSAYFG